METAAYRTLLDARLRDIVTRNEKVKERLRRAGGLPDDWTERATALEDEEVLEGLDTEARAEIVAIQAAIRRMDEGTYGFCAGCGEPIAPARLRALPFATTCIDCAR